VFGQPGAGECLTNTIVTDVGNLTQSVEKAERLKDGGVNANTDIGISCFDFLQGRAGREGTFRHDRHRETAVAASVVDIRTELAQGTLHSGRSMVRRWHIVYIALQISKICSMKLTFFNI